MSDSNNRRDMRIRALKAARIVLPGGHSTFDCLVRNLSRSGAKLVLESTIAIPDAFSLMFEDGTVHACELRWRTLKEIGVAFLDVDA